MKRLLDSIANIAVIVASVVLLVYLGSSWYASRNSPRPPDARALIGSTIHLPGVNLALGSKTLLIAISPNCRYCRESEPFYRQLAKIPGLQTHLIAVVPVPLAEGKSYVNSSIDSSLEVVSDPLSEIHVQNTPTLLLVDGQGRVKNAWIGKLDDAGQRSVQSEL